MLILWSDIRVYTVFHNHQLTVWINLSTMMNKYGKCETKITCRASLRGSTNISFWSTTVIFHD